MKKVYGYIRVSTVKQGTGVSLQEQKEAIIRYAEKHQLNIIQWFEELETAAKQGRPLFTNMMKLLRKGGGQGVIIHKIDRSARNLKDWAALGDLIDEGIEVHFAHESLDMDTRGGRLAADIQAVIASDYIRNLRQETLKGLYGRLKQGIYPFGAPIGYDNQGGGKLKTINPIQGPLVKQSFQLYASGKYTLDTLSNVMSEYGLRNAKGSPIPATKMSVILNNPFYAGVLKVKGKTFQGKHEPLISSDLYIKTQNILEGKTNSKLIKHDFLFRRFIKCADCGYSLIGEKQKGHIYYRCQTKACPTKTIREEKVEAALIRSLEGIQLYRKESQVLNELLHEAQLNWASNHKGVEESIQLQQRKISQKLERLTDALIDNIIDKDIFEIKKEKLLIELQQYQHKTVSLTGQKEVIFRKAEKFIELVMSVKKSYLIALTEEKRKIIKSVTSNLTIHGRKLMFTIISPFYEIVNRANLSNCGLDRGRPRTFVADLAINPQTGHAKVVNHWPILAQEENNSQLRENMKQLLDIILGFFEDEMKQVEAGTLKEEDMLISPYVQEDDTNSQFNTRPVPENFKRRRA